MPQSLDLETREVGEVTILTLSGPFVRQTADTMAECGKSLVETGKRKFVLGLEEVPEFDDAGVGCLLAFFTTVVRSGGQLKLLRPSLAVRIGFLKAHLIGRPSIETFFAVYLSEADALKAFDVKVNSE